MEYGYWVTNTVGENTFFVEGCTCCSMSTGGLHEPHCTWFNGQYHVPVWIQTWASSGTNDVPPDDALVSCAICGKVKE